MKRIKVLSIFGTRPEAIKMAPLVKKIGDDKAFESIICVTAQHREMLDSVLRIFGIKPQYDLDVMAHGQTIVDISNKVLKGVDGVIKESKPDIVLVHGDTSTTLNGALAAFYNQVPVGHVEAGLRSYDIYSPFPEEMNRKLTGAIASFHFSPTIINKQNLLGEGVSEEKIYITGNTVIDALLSVIDERYKFENETLNSIDFDNKKIILLTTHRRENWGQNMENIFQAIVQLVEENYDIEVIFPMHKNPTIRKLAHRYFNKYEGKVHLIEPLEYVEFANLMSKVYLIMTDSGGIQEEAPALGKPVMVLRTETERPEAVEAGTVTLAGVEKDKIVQVTNELINDDNKYNSMAQAINPYGDGKACQRIIDVIEKAFNHIGG